MTFEDYLFVTANNNKRKVPVPEFRKHFHSIVYIRDIVLNDFV